MDKELDNKILNYRITIQKLEEELSLYRNGTTNQQLIDFIGEKDTEIEGLKIKLSESAENYRKLAKSSREVLLRCDSLHQEKNDLLEQIKFLEDKLQTSELERESLLKTVKNLESAKAESEALNNDLSAQIDDTRNDLIEANESIDKLQQRCAALVQEKSEKNKSFEKEKQEKSRQLKELRDEVMRMTRLNTDLNQQLSQLQSETLELSEKLRDSQSSNSDLKRTISNLQKKFESEMSNTNEIKHGLENQINLLERNFQENVDRTSGLMAKCSNLEDLLQRKQMALEDIMHEKEVIYEESRQKEDRFKAEIHRLMDIQSSLQGRLLHTEEERDQNIVRKREYEASQMKITELENRIKSQELFFKKRLLHDRTGLSPFSSGGLNTGGRSIDEENKINGSTGPSSGSGGTTLSRRSCSPNLRSMSPVPTGRASTGGHPNSILSSSPMSNGSVVGNHNNSGSVNSSSSRSYSSGRLSGGGERVSFAINNGAPPLPPPPNQVRSTRR